MHTTIYLDGTGAIMYIELVSGTGLHIEGDTILYKTKFQGTVVVRSPQGEFENASKAGNIYPIHTGKVLFSQIMILL